MFSSSSWHGPASNSSRGVRLAFVDTRAENSVSRAQPDANGKFWPKLRPGVFVRDARVLRDVSAKRSTAARTFSSEFTQIVCVCLLPFARTFTRRLGGFRQTLASRVGSRYRLGSSSPFEQTPRDFQISKYLPVLSIKRGARPGAY